MSLDILNSINNSVAIMGVVSTGLIGEITVTLIFEP